MVAASSAARARASASSAFSVSISSGGESMSRENHNRLPRACGKCARTQLSRAFRSECVNRVTPVDSVEHVGELCGRYRDGATRRRRPNEATALQPLGVKRQAETVMPKDLDQVSPGATEDEKIAGERIATERLLYLQGETVHAAPHVGPTHREPDAHARGDRDHRRLKTSRTRLSERGSKPEPTRTR